MIYVLISQNALIHYRLDIIKIELSVNVHAIHELKVILIEFSKAF